MIRDSILGLIALLLVANGCTSTGQARSVETSGFLQDLYPRMHKGAEGEALLVYKNPQGRSTVGNATKIMLDPVLVYRGSDVKIKGIPQAQAQLMADTFLRWTSFRVFLRPLMS